jgi:DNA-binding beta-propeller fold protein YncE
MKKFIVLLFLLIMVAVACKNRMPGEIVLLAGTGEEGFKDGTPGELNKPIRFTPYKENSVIFADINNHAVRIVTLEGEVTTIAGGPEKKGYKDGPADEAMFNSPHGVAYNKSTGKLYVSEAGNHIIREITLADNGNHLVKTFAGIPEKPGFRDGPADSAMFLSPHAVILGNEGEVIVADIGNARVRSIKNGIVSTIAGSGESGSSDGAPEEATFKYAMDMVLDGSDILLADAGSHLIRRIVPGREVSTVIINDTLNTPHGIAIDSDKNIYIADMGTHRILKIDNDKNVMSIAGTGISGSKLNELNKPAAVLVYAGYLWIADLNNHQIKVMGLE